MTGRPLDHLVITVRDLDAAALTYEALGFTLTPRAAHDDHMGTSNRLAQFRGHTFLEILEVDRPDGLTPHDFDATPPVFSFGAHNRAAAALREGGSLIVFAGDDARADAASFAARGVGAFAPFDFSRKARLPDGGEVTVSFTLAFAASPEMPEVGLFVCENRAQEHFWKPAFQDHENGAADLAAIYVASASPDRDAAFFAGLFDGATRSVEGGVAVACGEGREIVVLDPGAVAAIDRTAAPVRGDGPRIVGIALRSDAARPMTPAADAHGVFITWRV